MDIFFRTGYNYDTLKVSFNTALCCEDESLAQPEEISR